MNRFTALFGAAIVAVGFGVATFAHEGSDHKESTEGKKATIQGELIDTACFVTSDGDAKGKDHAECATKCMTTGVPAGILPEGSKDSDELLFLLTNPTVLAKYAGQTIKVEGTSYEHKHAFDVEKLWVKSGNDWKEVQLKDEHHNMGDKKDDMGGMHMDHK